MQKRKKCSVLIFCKVMQLWAVYYWCTVEETMNYNRLMSLCFIENYNSIYHGGRIVGAPIQKAATPLSSLPGFTGDSESNKSHRFLSLSVRLLWEGSFLMLCVSVDIHSLARECMCTSALLSHSLLPPKRR